MKLTAGELVDLIGIDAVNRLIREAGKAPVDNRHGSRHAAVILAKNMQPICYGFNIFSRHAELHAIQKWLATPKFRGKKAAAIVVIRRNKTGKLTESKPCEKCQVLLDGVGLKVYHS